MVMLLGLSFHRGEFTFAAVEAKYAGAKNTAKNKTGREPFRVAAGFGELGSALLLDLVASRAQAPHLGRYPERVAVSKGEAKIKSARVHRIQAADSIRAHRSSQRVCDASARALIECRPADEGEDPHREPVQARDEHEHRPPAAVAGAMEDLLNGDDQYQDGCYDDRDVGRRHSEHGFCPPRRLYNISVSCPQSNPFRM
jgi:hypothetical protein